MLFSIGLCKAHDGDNPGAIDGDNGWKSFELITENDSLSSLLIGQSYVPGDSSSSGTFAWNGSIHNHWDGLGALKTSVNNLRVLVNHEGTDDATITAVDVNIPNLQTWALNFPSATPWPGPNQVVTGIGNAFSTVDVTTGNSGRILKANPISRLCSGNVWQPDTFGAGRGFADQLFLTGEEDLTNTGLGGSIWVLDVQTNTMYEAPDVAPLGGRWENACIVDTGNTQQVAILVSSDGGSEQIYLYIGTKNESPTASFLERNGLVGGQVFQFDPAGAETTLPISGTSTGTFSTSTTEPLEEPKFEDIHVNPNDPTKVALAEQNKGVYEIEFQLQFNIDGTLDTERASYIVSLLESANDDDGTSGGNLSNPDNLVWSADGNVYVNEDGSGNDAWQLDPVTSEVIRIADGHTTETSGVIDISSLVGFKAGSILLTNSYDGNGINGDNGALYMLVSPDASMLPNVLIGDINLDGSVNLLDIAPFVELLTSVAFQAEADVNGDGLVSLLDVEPFVVLLAG